MKRLFLLQKAMKGKLIEQTEPTPLSSPFIGSDIYDTMFSDSTRGDISPSDLGSGEGSGDDNDFTMFDTSLFTGSTVLDTDSTAIEESESPVNETTMEAGTGTTEFGTEVTESSDITEDTDVTFEGSGTTIEEGSGTSPEEGSGASASTNAFTEETTVEETQASTSAVTAESDSRFLSHICFTTKVYYRCYNTASACMEIIKYISLIKKVSITLYIFINDL